ncbi:MAG TPA: hypothetical protein VHQ42_04210 [Candidatus Limnocylindria bacterium]|nr:hypothetical protein [Candidatus Limnocylindria bacterium]
MTLLLGSQTLVPPGPGVAYANAPPKVAIVVGPAGSDITPLYLHLAELAAVEAEERGATVARAYSPDATPERVLEATTAANIIIYFGHGTGFPNPYSETLNPETVNGWGLQGPASLGTHDDSLAAGTLRYYGEAWLEANLRPAPGFVMIYSNACYAPGASEGGQPRPTEEEALAHVANYSRPMLDLGASAYFATDFYAGAAGLVARLLDDPAAPYGRVFRDDPLFDEAGLATFPHPQAAGAEVWLHRSIYLDGAEDYWYAFAGDPARQLDAITGAASPAAAAPPPAAAPVGLLATGRASSYPSQPGYGERPTAALPEALGGRALTETGWVAVCGDRCVIVPVVDSCPCYWGTDDARVINLSHAAWAAVTDDPLAEGLVDVRVYRDGLIPAGEAPRRLYPDMPPIPPAAP